ncbi:MAG: hypothetical protein RL726_2077, partial [Actinomycetota bacterium]
MKNSEPGTDVDYFDITELVERANARARSLNIGDLTVRAVRFYIQRGLFTKGLMVNQLPEIRQRSLTHKGNQRFFTDDDVATLVNIKGQLDAGKTVADLGGREIRESSRPSHDDDLSMRKMLFTELNAMMTPITDEIVLSAIDYSFNTPRVEKSWTVTLRDDVTLHGTGVAPSEDAVRELVRVVNTHFAPLAAASMPANTGTLKIEIELADIASPFSGGIVNSSDAEVTAGGGASARIWEVCGHDEIGRERQ